MKKSYSSKDTPKTFPDIELASQYKKITKLLRVLKGEFLRLAVVEAEGILPLSLMTTDEMSELNGKSGLTEIIFHGHKCSCSFTPIGGERISWCNDDADCPGKYESLLFYTWDYTTGYALNRDEQYSHANWYVSDPADASLLEYIAKKIDKLLLPLLDCKGLIFTNAKISSSIRPLELPMWKPGRFEWSFIQHLDEAIKTCETMIATQKLPAQSKPAETEQKTKPDKAPLLESIRKAYQNLERATGADVNLDGVLFDESVYAEAAVIDYLTERFGEQDDEHVFWPSDWGECPEAFELYKEKIREFRLHKTKSSLKKVESIAEQQETETKDIITADANIPAERRTTPLSLERMARYWGGEMTAKKLKAMIESGRLKAIQLNRQTFVFDTKYLPAEVINKVKS
jgi:hypothetical protein